MDRRQSIQHLFEWPTLGAALWERKLGAEYVNG